MDFWVWMFVVSSTFASYVGKVSVRVDLQRIGFAIPGFIAPIFGVVLTVIFDSLSYRNRYPQIHKSSILFGSSGDHEKVLIQRVYH